MKNIALARIDDRLIHGQVVTAWIKQYPINKILIIDDELSRNSLMKRIYVAAAPAGIEVIILPLEDAIAFLKEDDDGKSQYLILSKVPAIMLALLNHDIPLKKVILGGMGAKTGRKTFNRNVSASEEEVRDFSQIMDKGVEIIYQLVPDDKEVNIKNLMN